MLVQTLCNDCPSRAYVQKKHRSLTQREDLPQQYAVGPHVTLGGEHLVKDGLGRHPLERESGLAEGEDTGLPNLAYVRKL